MLDNLLLYPCLKGCIFKVSSSRDGRAGGFDVRVHLEKEGVGGRGGDGEAGVTITTGLYQECLHRGRGQDRVCPLRNRNILLHQSHHQSAASSFKVTTDG